MHNAITYLDERYGISGVNSKVLQALIKARSSEDVVEEYIERMDDRFNENSAYEILKAAFNTNNWDLARRYIRKVKSSARGDLLILRTYFRMGDLQASRKFFSKLTPSNFNESQVLQIIRIGLQFGDTSVLEKWFEQSPLDENQIEVELAKNQYRAAIADSNFEQAISLFKKIYDSESFTRRQILVLTKSTKILQSRR